MSFLKKNLLKKATIRNAKLCLETENFGHYTVFDVDRDNKGWDTIQSATLFGVSAGFAFLSATNASPSLSRATKFASIDAGLYTEIVVKYKYVRNREDSVATEGKIQFTTSSSLTFDDDKSITFTVNPDGKWNTYYINMAPVTAWVGNITNLKIFFTTNGKKNDEIFIEYIKVQNPSFQFCSDSCIEVVDTTISADNFDIEVINSSPQNWSISQSNSEKQVSIAQDPETSTNKVMSLLNSTGTTLGPVATKVLSNPVRIGFLSFRARVTSEEGKITLLKDVSLDQALFELKFNTDGFIKYREGALTFVDFQTPVPFSVNNWYDFLITFNADANVLSVFISGVLVGSSIPYIFSGNAIAIKVTNEGIDPNSVLIDDVLLVEHEEEGSCPGIGKQGEATGQPVAFNRLTIQEGINDSIIVNLNDYGDVTISLQALAGADLFEIRDELERQLSSLDIGGYPNSEVIIVEGIRLKIKSGTYGFDSSVVVKPNGGSNLAFELGFCDSVGFPIYESKAGRPHSPSFNFTNTYRAKTYELNSLKRLKDEDYPLIHNPTLLVAEIGSREAGTISRSVTIEGSNKTIIDFYNRATSEGVITELFFHGVLPTTIGEKVFGNQGQANYNLFLTGMGNLKDLGVVAGDVLVIDEPGYQANGEYVISRVVARSDIVELEGGVSLPFGTGLTFSIHNIPKVKHFRPKKDGTLSLINEAVIGLETSGLFTNNHDVYKIPIQWTTHRGDMLGIYNATVIFAGNDPNDSEDALYIEEVGDLRGEAITVSLPKGQGVKGIGLYGRSSIKQTRAVYDIEFDDLESIDYFEIKGKQDLVNRRYSIASAVDQGFSVQVNTSGTHIHHVFRVTDAERLEIAHNNIAYNVNSLTDGIKFADNGFLGVFEQDVAEATYFYVSGDGEFAEEIEFPFPSGILVHEFISDYEDDIFDILMTWNAEKDIDTFIINFKDYPNSDGYFLEYLKDSRSTFDGSSPGFEKIGEGNTTEFTTVKLDKLVLDRGFVSDDSVFFRKFKTTFDAYANLQTSEGAKAMQEFSKHPYTVVEKQFNSVRTTALNWRCLSHRSTKIAEIDVLSSTDTNADLSGAIEFYFSIDGETFQRVDPEVVATDRLRYKIGFPTNFLRIIVSPTSILSLDELKVVAAEDNIRYKNALTEIPIDVVNMELVKGEESPVEKITITNNLCDNADLYISIDVEETTDDIILKSSMNTLEEVLDPEIGPDGFLLQDPDFDLPVTDNVAINAEVYGLTNLAEFKKYYISDQFETESDYFFDHVEGTKWDQDHTNFPQSGIDHRFPGFSVVPFPGPTGAPATSSLTARLVSRWRSLGSFNAFIRASMDARGSNGEVFGAFIGIKDDTGRVIYISKERAYFQGLITGDRSWYDFTVRDTLTGLLDSVREMCEDFCSPIFGDPDDFTESYFLNVNRFKDGSIDKLRFSYLDPINGITGNYQWGDDQDYFEIDLTTLSTPLVGNLKLVIGHQWTKSALLSLGVPGPSGTYSTIHSFSYGGESTFADRHISFEGFRLTGVSGSVLEDNKSDVVPVKFIALDLGKPYVLDVLQNYTFSSNLLWNALNAQYSNTNTSNIGEVEWGNSNFSDARWILFQEETVPEASSNEKYLDHLRVYPDISRSAHGELYNTEWSLLDHELTDGNRDTYLTQIDYPIIAIKLANQFEMSDFRLLDRSNLEFEGRSLIFNGWGERADFTISSGITDDPRLVTWQPWKDYLASNKVPQPVKWFAFRNENFDVNNGGGEKQYAAEFIVSTTAEDSDNIGQVNDRVDFTEYAEWFKLNTIESSNVAILESEEYTANGVLFGSSSVASAPELNDLLGDASEAFDDSLESKVPLQTLPMYIWRLFGQLSTVTGTTQEEVGSGDDQVLIDFFGSEDLQVSLEPTIIDGFEIVLDVETPGVPNTIELQVLSGTDPLEDSNWVTVFSDDDLASTVTGSEDSTNPDAEFSEDIVELRFNEGNPYIVTFEESILVSGVRLLITDAVFSGSVDETVSISEFRIFQGSQGSFSPLSITNDAEVREGGRRSLKLTYSQGSSSSASMTSAGNFNLAPDDKWSIQDFLSFYMKIDRPDLLDFSNSYIRLGKDSETYYGWSLESLQSEVSSVGLKHHLLRFLDAGDKALGQINLTLPDRAQLESQVDFINGPINFFEIVIQPIGTASSDINIWLDRFTIERENFSLAGRYNNTLYLNNSELVYYPMTGFNMNRGYFEAIITPDWGSEGRTTLKVEEVFTIFTAVNDLGESFSLFYDVRSGLIFSVAGEDTRTILDVGYITIIQKYKPVKIGILWDSEGKRIDARSGATFRLYINDSLAGDFIQPWNITPSKNSFFLIGSRAYQTAVAFNPRERLPTTSAIKIVPKTASITGGIENVLLSSEPVKLSFTDRQLLKDKIFISLDNITFVPASSTSLPFIIENVAHGDSVDLWIKTNLPLDTRGLSRTAFINTRWRVA